MDAKTLQNIFIKILRSELNETELDSAVKDQLTPDVLSALYLLSKRHDLAHIVANSLYKNGFVDDDEIFSKFSQENIKSVYRCIQMNYALKEICNTFNEEQIPYIPLKGSVIRPYYPEESMRTSCDIDILVKMENLDTAIDALIQKGYKCGERNYHNVSLYSPNKIHLELHFNIQENIDTLDVVLKDAWNYVTHSQGCCYEFTKEFFLFHMFAHMSYHLLSGGCGVKSLIDIWIMEHKMGITYLQAKDLLERAGIYVFATEISNLADACFYDQPQNDFSEMLLSYILDGGVYGSLENHIAINESKTHVNLSYILLNEDKGNGKKKLKRDLSNWELEKLDNIIKNRFSELDADNRNEVIYCYCKSKAIQRDNVRITHDQSHASMARSLSLFSLVVFLVSGIFALHDWINSVPAFIITMIASRCLTALFARRNKRFSELRYVNIFRTVIYADT